MAVTCGLFKFEWTSFTNFYTESSSSSSSSSIKIKPSSSSESYFFIYSFYFNSFIFPIDLGFAGGILLKWGDYYPILSFFSSRDGFFPRELGITAKTGLFIGEFY